MAVDANRKPHWKSRLALISLVACLGMILTGLYVAISVSQMPERLVGSITYWVYFALAIGIGFVAVFLGMAAYGLTWRFVESVESINGVGPTRIIWRLYDYPDQDGSANCFDVVLVGRGLWFVSAGKVQHKSPNQRGRSRG